MLVMTQVVHSWNSNLVWRQRVVAGLQKDNSFDEDTYVKEGADHPAAEPPAAVKHSRG
jgi:hypothetical protein